MPRDIQGPAPESKGNRSGFDVKVTRKPKNVGEYVVHKWRIEALRHWNDGRRLRGNALCHRLLQRFAIRWAVSYRTSNRAGKRQYPGHHRMQCCGRTTCAITNPIGSYLMTDDD